MLATRFVATLWPRRWLPALAVLFLSACGGGGGDSTTPTVPGTQVTISGTITFDRIPFKATVNAGLDFANPIQSPARSVVVQALNASGSVLATTSTDATGAYSVQVPAGQTVRIRARAQMVSNTAPAMDFRVLDNTNADALYVLDGAASSSGTADSTRNLRAASGWGGSTYTSTRAAAPFAILDTVYRAKELILTADPGASFPALNLYWSSANKATTNEFCTDTGDLGTTFYTEGSNAADNCSSGGVLGAGIYILGDFASGVGDTDEFDQHVIAHEFGHYVESQFSRSDSIGGMHSGGELLDLRLAFGEGWGNAYSGMVLNDPVYRDSSGTNSDGGMNMETDGILNEGWFSEASVDEILWDAFDTVDDANDTIALGFAPIFSVMRNAQTDTDALTSIYSFANGLRSANSSSASGITALLTGEDITGTDDFGAGEMYSGGSTFARPVYRTLALGGGPTLVCTNTAFGDYNKLDNRRFFVFTVMSGSGAYVAFTAAGAASGGSNAATDPDIIVRQRGVDLGLDGEDEPQDETIETTTQVLLAAGTYTVEVYDWDLIDGNNTSSCMTVSVNGTGN